MTRACAGPKRTTLSLSCEENPFPSMVTVWPARAGLLIPKPLIESDWLGVPATSRVTGLEETPFTTMARSINPLPLREEGNLRLIWSRPANPWVAPKYSMGTSFPPMRARME